MSDKPKGIQEGPPIWVESTMTRDEWKARHRKYPFTSPKAEPTEYDESYHKGGKWRAGMGSGLNQSEINNINKNLDYLLTLVETKHLTV